MLRRRRPLATAALVGGAAYVGSKKGAQAGQAEAEPQYEEAPAPAAAPAAPPAPGGMSDEAMAQLENLAKLKEQGILTDAEFEIQKQKILQGM